MLIITQITAYFWVQWTRRWSCRKTKKLP